MNIFLYFNPNKFKIFGNTNTPKLENLFNLGSILANEESFNNDHYDKLKNQVVPYKPNLTYTLINV